MCTALTRTSASQLGSHLTAMATRWSHCQKEPRPGARVPPKRAERGDRQDARQGAFVMKPPSQISTRLTFTGSRARCFTSSNNCLRLHVYLMSDTLHKNNWPCLTYHAMPRRTINSTARACRHSFHKTFRVGPGISLKSTDDQIWFFCTRCISQNCSRAATFRGSQPPGQQNIPQSSTSEQEVDEDVKQEREVSDPCTAMRASTTFSVLADNLLTTPREKAATTVAPVCYLWWETSNLTIF